MAISLKEAICRDTHFRRIDIREDAEIEARAELLPPADRSLVLAAWIYQQPTAMIAQLRGTSRHAVRRRVRCLVGRLHSEEFIGAARALRLLAADRAEVARLHFCHGLSLRATAKALGMSYHKARRTATEIHGLIRGLNHIRQDAARAATDRRRS